MQRKISNIKYKLHSIPILLNMKNKSNVLYSIPCVKACAHFCRKNSCNSNHNISNSYSTHGVWWRSQNRISHSARAVILTRASQVVMTPLSRMSSWNKISAFTFLVMSVNFWVNMVIGSNGSCYAANATSASLSLSNPNMTSNAITPGNTTTVSTNVSVKVDNAESYSLILKVDSTTLKNGSTTINAGNVVNDNTWGYKWDIETSYTAPSTSGKNLTVPALTNNSVDFTKTLTFGAKFSTSAEAGHYRGSGTLSLVAEPRIILGIWSTGTNSGITTMQEMTSTVCDQVATPDGKDLAGIPTIYLQDSRDGEKYRIAKYPDGKCWMVDNLRLVGTGAAGQITANNSNVSSDSTFVLPISDVSRFNLDFDNQAVYYHPETNTGYYTWCAATAGTCASATSGRIEVSSSICPRGWELPGGCSNTLSENDFYTLFTHMNLAISNSLSGGSGSGTNFNNSDFNIIKSPIYNFTLTGMVHNQLFRADDTGRWWSRTSLQESHAYLLSLTSDNVYPGTHATNRYQGFAIRCIAQSSTSSGGQTSSPK